MYKQCHLQLLEAMRKRLISKGWRRGSAYMYNTNQRCLLETMDAVADNINMSYIESLEVIDLFKFICAPENTNPDDFCIVSFNDSPSTKFKDILDLIDQAISVITSELENN
jgi:hypothetical protein